MGQSEQSPFISFAARLRRDHEAVMQGMSSSFNPGPVEGHVNRIKLIKRNSYGKMGFPTLRQRTLLAQAN